jgi:hypothetical protein
MDILKLTDVTDGISDEKFLEFFGGKVDNSIVGLDDNALLTGDVILLKVLKNKNVTLYASVSNDIVRISGHLSYEDSWSDKDERIGVRLIKGLINGEYETAVIEKTPTESIIILIPKEIL